MSKESDLEPYDAMKLALDARTIFDGARRGTGKNLIDLYRHVAGLRPQWRIVMFCRTEGGGDPFAGIGNIERRRIDIPGDRLDLWQQVRLPAAALAIGADVLHCPANTAPRVCPVRRVVTIHDLIPLDRRFATPASARWGANVRRAARKAAAIITPSAYSAKQIERAFGVSADKVTVNPWAADAACRKVTDGDELAGARRRIGLTDDRPYVLAYGGADPRKNTVGILRAWAAIPKATRKNCALVVVGIQPTAMDAFADQVRQLEIADSCVLAGFAAEEDMPALLTGATVLCYASLSEGFGLPILDAFVCETPVLTSDATSLPEVAGDAAVLVDPEDPRSIAGGLAELLDKPERRAELIARGAARAKAFAWTATAERTIGVFESVMK